MAGDSYTVQVRGPHFTAGLVFNARGEGRVIRTAPILKALYGLTADQARDYIRKRGWTASVVLPSANSS